LLLNYKGSVGFGCLTLLFIAWVFDAVTEKSRWHAFVYFLLYILTFETCFKAVSGHWNSTDYLRVLFNLSSGYSETHAMVPPNDSLYYWGGLFAVAALAMAWNYIRLRVLPRFTIIFFLMSIFLWLYFEYKHGFVRAEVVHINWFFKDIFTILLFWAIGHQTHKRCASTLTILFLILALASFINAQQLLGTRTFSGLFNARLQEVKSLPFNTVIPNQHKPQELANDKLSLNLYQNLFQFMHREAATFQGPQRPTLSVVSNQVILLRYLPDFETHFMPSLLQYISAGCPSIQRKNRAFLTDPSRPDYLLFGNLTPDESCLPIYQSHTLAPLLENYEQISYLDGFYILKRKMGGPENVQTILPQLSIPPPSRCFLLAHSILKFIFKAPVLMLRVAFLNQETQKLIIMNDRITLIDLQNGVFSGPFSFPRNFHQPPGSHKNTVIVLKVQTYWTGWGSWFMKPWAHLPIEVKYIDPRDIPIKR